MKTLTKILATLGPATESDEQIRGLLSAGVNVLRFNTKHNDLSWHDRMIGRVNALAREMGVSVGTFFDLQGPEIRLIMKGDSLEITKGEKVLLDPSTLTGEEKGFTLSTAHLIPTLADGQTVIADDGRFVFTVKKIGKKVYLVSQSAGLLRTRKTFNIPGADLDFPSLIDRDIEGLRVGSKHEVDFVGLSFVRSAEDIELLKKEMKKYRMRAKIMAKIETTKGIDRLDEILEAADGLIVARGDLAIEAPYERVPAYQKYMIRKALEKRKTVVTATQMLLSMTSNPFPTRAEISDVANAVYDHTDAVWFSEETAMGKYPVEVIEKTTSILSYNEMQPYADMRTQITYPMHTHEELLCNAAYDLYLKSRQGRYPISQFVVFTQSGRSAQFLSAFRPQIPIVAIVPNEETADSLTLDFGVLPYRIPVKTRSMGMVRREQIFASLEHLVKKNILQRKSRILVLFGDQWAKVGGVSNIKIVQL